MVRNIDYAKLSKTLECGICLSVVHNPKQLVCNHSFCRACLDKILVFAPNGSGSIKCPNGCESETLISSTQTTNDLEINFMLKSVLDLTVEETGEDDPNATIKCSTCSRIATKYCTECCVFKCDHCPEVHNKSSDRLDAALIPIDVSGGDEKCAIMCLEHKAEAEYSCCKTQFVCTYCVHRGKHNEHMYEPLTEVDQLKRTFALLKVEANADLEEAKKRALDQMEQVEKKMDTELKRRKLDCLMNYMQYLDESDVKIRNDFKQVCEDYQSAFESVDFLEKCLAKDDFHLRLSRSKITKMEESVYMNDVERIPGTTVSLDCDSSDDSFPLGRLKATHCTSCEGFHGKFSSVEKERDSSLPVPLFMEKLRKLTQELNNAVTNYVETGSECESEDDSGIQESWHSFEEDSSDSETNVLKRNPENHECVLKPIPYLPLQNSSYTVESSFELQNVSQVYGRVYSDPITMKNFVFQVMFQPVNLEDVKHAGLYVQCDYMGYKSSWFLQCDVEFRLKAIEGTDVTHKLSKIYAKKANAWGTRRMIKWEDLVDPQKGLLSEEDSLRIETVIECKSVNE